METIGFVFGLAGLAFALIANSRLNKLEDKLELRSKAFSLLLFKPLIHGIHTRQDALYVMGLPPSDRPDLATLRGRYRELATIYHPDGELGNHDHMSQLNAAMDFLSK